MCIFVCVCSYVCVCVYVCVICMCLTRHQFEGRTPTPLELAAEAGKHETVAYLLSIPGVSAEGVPSDQVIHIYLACHCV